jgi:peroxiredoxin Q/BCP
MKFEKAKDFIAITHRGERISLEQFKGRKVWLAFFRYASCPLCNLHIHSIIKRYDEFEKAGIVFLPVFQSSVEEVMKYAGGLNLPFPIICDPAQELYKLYDVGSSYKGFISASVLLKMSKAFMSGFLPGKIQGDISRLPSDFLFSENQEIIFRYDGKDIGDHADLEIILEKALP